jgi:hypothetical protein
LLAALNVEHPALPHAFTRYVTVPFATTNCVHDVPEPL